MSIVSPESRENGSPLVRVNKLDLLERLADDLAHEIKNPLHSLVINLEVLKRRIARVTDAQTDDILRYVGVIDGELHRVNQRIELLLHLVRPARRTDTVPLSELIDDLFELIELEGSRRKVAVRYRPALGTTRARIGVDAGRQIVLNMVLSVLDLIPAGGALTLRTTVAETDVELWVHGVPDGDGVAGDATTLDEADPRLDIVRMLCQRIGALLLMSEPDETPDNLIGIRIPLQPR
jgi:two-component system, sporulation sensor kinase E